MINKEIIINRQTRDTKNGENGNLFRLGVDNENLQENIIFKFDDEFVNGTARVEITMQDGTKSYIMTTKENETYILPIKSVITKKGLNKMQLVITQGTNQEEIPIFKSKMFDFYIDESINAQSEAPEEYPQWIDEANTKLNELDNLDIDAEKVENTATITITKKDETQEIIHIYDGEQGEVGPQGPEGPAGKDGADGKDGRDGVDGKNGVDGKDGKDGENGQDGFSPVVSTSKSGKITTIEITDKNGTHTATINDGVDGQNGQNGQDGQDGYSPSASVSQSGDTTTISITDKNGTTSASIDLSNKQNVIQYSTMPTASLSNLGKVVQYVGTTNSTYTNGYFYICIVDNNVYSWQQLNVQPAGASGNFADVKNINNQTIQLDTIEKGVYYANGTTIYIKQNSSASSQTFNNCQFVMIKDKISNELENGIFCEVFYIDNGAYKTKAYYYSNGSVFDEALFYGYLITSSSQTFNGIKKFGSIPQVSSYSVPTQDTELTAKKYVDDQISLQIGNINTILATLTTPSNE